MNNSNSILLFIDTNVLLDFYRERKSDISLKFLTKIEELIDYLIIGSQIEMEYKKNRQIVILESLGKFSTPDWGKLTTPALVSELQVTASLKKSQEIINNQQKKISEKIKNILEKPGTHDEVYKVLQRIFKKSTPYNLNRSSKIRFEIRRLARKRFCLGYPPRKKGDNSIGDAINWEWIIHCSIKSGKDIIIVSRDGDYGAIYKDKSFLNDWLKQEFKERVSRKRKIILTAKLSEAFKLMNEQVTQEMEQAEVDILENHIINSCTPNKPASPDRLPGG